ncbi:hypothetical protein H0R92_11135 [Treponema sp. OMZ 840]|uniref:hypothetical protein n=1 Tax=Treponema sp. OMZ 840 TaxID=244313 RepID=UPI003D946B58
MIKKNVLKTVLLGFTVLAMISCGQKKGSTTADIVAKASKMSIEKLEAASKAEMEASTDTFKVIGLTSALKTAVKQFADTYDWLHYGQEGVQDNVYINNSYKDYTLLTALEVADNTYFADYALIQDVRSLADYDTAGLVHNYVPSDWKDMGLTEKDIYPLKGIHFNKLFYTNTNFEKVTGKKLYNIWQLAGTPNDPDHLDKISFQSPVTEQINMSFLLSCEAPENQDRIKAAYKNYYNKEWQAGNSGFTSAGQQWVTEFIANVSRWHASDGTAMKETQLKYDWDRGYVYYGAFAKMKDASTKYYGGIVGADKSFYQTEEAKDKKGKVVGKVGTIQAMKTVKYNWEIDGFNGFMYTMCSQIVNNAAHPYTACLFARFLLSQECYEAMIYNSLTPDADGKKANQYGYYYPGSNDIKYAKGDWDKNTHIAKEINEDYSFLKNIKISQVNNLLALVTSNKKANTVMKQEEAEDKAKDTK